MASNSNISHVVVTPSRNESDLLPKLAYSMTSQTLIPSKWVIVAHNSGQSTREILEELCINNDWISCIYVDDSSQRKRGAQIARLVNRGLSSISLDWDFFSKIDADMVLPNDYFERIFSKFSNSKKLGIASGSCFLIEKGKKTLERVSPDHTRGGLKTYRRDCFDKMGGIRDCDGWDGLDNISAQVHGWETRSFGDMEVLHQRRTGSYSGLISGCFESGRFAYSMGYFPPFMIARSIHRMGNKPMIVGGISMFIGYLTAPFRGQRRIADQEIVSYLRNNQKNRLKPW